MATNTALSPPRLGDLSPIALMLVDERRRIIEVNAACESLLQLSRRAMKGKPLSEIVYHDSPVFELLDRVQRTVGDIAAPGTPVSGPGLLSRQICDIWVRTTDDNGYMIALCEAATRDANDSAAGVAGFGRILGHEVKNPLGGIIGAAQLLERHGVDGQAELLEIIKEEARRIERLVNRLSAFELFSAPQMEPFNIHAVLDRVLASEQAAMGSHVEFKRDFDPSLPQLMGDSDHLQQAFQNLIRNAAEAASEEGASGKVSVRTSYAAGLSFRQARLGSGLRRAMLVSVEDNGRGIPRHRQGTIFEVFQSSKSGARGLGLSIVKEVITAHGGQIRVDSVPGSTRFAVLLPLGTEEKVHG
ncbi:MAG: PAS domain-containing protein [Alphaproteobacteria bacterium]|nr:PAS domain-containing sensor histidine kinase [Hyphomonas sp.]MBR9805707.1 PAS domain-containing protein [Alphaproteobacteria bacterium]|tara:strand:- start:3733 stop:4806 length:1074 start_codon:yes stop_codon:yes gene_type:complete